MTLTDICLALLVILLAVFVVLAVALSERRQGASAEQIQKRGLIYAFAISFWLLLTAVLAGRGLLGSGETFPPKPLFIVLPTLILVLVFVFSSAGSRLVRGLKMWELVGFQAFRLPVELVLLGYFFETRVPLAMTLEGRNFDVFTALSSVVVAPLLFSGTLGRRAVLVWNICGLALLFNIIFLAAASLAVFAGESGAPVNTLPFQWPSIWILFCVLVALVSHLLIFRKLRQGTP
jgi:hypothetical protein